LPFELQVALRYLTARRKQAFLSLISAISVLGVSVGVMALLIALALMTGLQAEIRANILGTTAHVSVFRARGEGRDDSRGGIRDYAAVIDAIKRVPHVLGAAPAVYGKALISVPANASAATLKGILPQQERSVTDLDRQLETGSVDALAADAAGDGLPSILLGRDLASSLGVAKGDVVRALTPQGRLSPLGVLSVPKLLRVAGTFKSGIWEFDSAWGYVPFGVAQRLFDVPDGASLVEVRIDDIFAVKQVGRGILERLGNDYVTTDWIEMNHSLFSALWLEKTAIGITIGLIVLVAALNIVATLVLMVMEKHKDIAILVSMGASRASITRIFVLQGTLIGSAGTLIGGLAGIVVCRVLDAYRLIRIPGDVYQISYVPFTLLPGDAALVLIGAMLVCFLATIHPARQASRIDPAEALRYE
jgi:lipoprotein-releasing system permease protein